MAKPTLSEISKLFKTDDKPTDFHYYGTVVSADVENRTYEVSINRDENITVEAARLVGAHVGDTVMVTVMANGYATVTGRVGGDTDASDAQRKADGASTIADEAQRKAVNALGKATSAEQLASQAEQNAKRSADAAELAEQNASDSADYANKSKIASEQAQQAAETAQQNAADSQTAAETAQQNAADSQTAAETARDRAVTAEGYADAAKTQAENANQQASIATSYANGALTGLSTVQDVIGVLDWAQKNAQYSLTGDTQIEPGKIYWTRSGSGTSADPYVYSPVVNPAKEDLGTYYEISGVDEAMANYINTHLALVSEGGANDGLYVLSDRSGWKVRIANDGVYIIDPQGNTATKYKDAVTLGNDDGSQSYQYLDYHSMQLIDKEGGPYFYISDLRDSSGYAIIEEHFRTDGISNRFTTMLKISEVLDISAYGVSDPPVYSINYKTITFDEVPAKKVAGVYVRYKTNDRNAKAFTLGTRDQFGVVGPMSFAEGDNIKASGLYSHAEGSFTTAHGESSHAEGDATYAGGKNSHAEGYHSMANGLRSHAQNFETIASGLNQTALGRYNIEDNDDTYSVIIGNGTNDNNRSNAATVDWRGNIWTAETVTAKDMTEQEIADYMAGFPQGTDKYTNLLDMMDIIMFNCGSIWPTVELYNCTGTLANNLYIRNKGDVFFLNGRIAITNFARKGSNPGVQFKLNDKKPTKEIVHYPGIRAESPREVCFFNWYTDGYVRLRTSESYTNASGSTLTLIIPSLFVCVE